MFGNLWENMTLSASQSNFSMIGNVIEVQKPGTVTTRFVVENSGQEESMLVWEVEDHPSLVSVEPRAGQLVPPYKSTVYFETSSRSLPNNQISTIDVCVSGVPGPDKVCICSKLIYCSGQNVQKLLDIHS